MRHPGCGNGSDGKPIQAVAPLTGRRGCRVGSFTSNASPAQIRTVFAETAFGVLSRVASFALGGDYILFRDVIALAILIGADRPLRSAISWRAGVSGPEHSSLQAGFVRLGVFSCCPKPAMAADTNEPIAGTAAAMTDQSMYRAFFTDAKAIQFAK